MGASMNGNLEVVKLLLDKDAFVNQQDAQGRPPLCTLRREATRRLRIFCFAGAPKRKQRTNSAERPSLIATIYGNYGCGLHAGRGGRRR